MFYHACESTTLGSLHWCDQTVFVHTHL